MDSPDEKKEPGDQEKEREVQVPVPPENNPNAELPMKCRKCRSTLFVHPAVTVTDSHGEHGRPCPAELWFVREDELLDWMITAVMKGEWTKGKINCPYCNYRIGSFNFIRRNKCICGSQERSILTPVHITKSKVDFIRNPVNFH